MAGQEGGGWSGAGERFSCRPPSLWASAHLNWGFKAGVTLWYRAISRESGI